MKNLILLIMLYFLFSCQDGPKAAFNEDFVRANPKKELPFKKLIGVYNLDNDSKKRYKITFEDSIKLIIKKDSSFTAENYLDYKTDTLQLKKLEGKLLYRNNFKESIMYLQPKSGKLNGWGGIEIYYRKKDSVIALYVYTPPLKGKENGDYLRYIKINQK